MKRMKKFAGLCVILAMLVSLTTGCTPAEPPSPNGGDNPTQQGGEGKKELSFNYANSNAWAVANPAGASNPDRRQAVEDYIYEQCGVRVNTTLIAGDAGLETLNLLLGDGSIDVFESSLLKKGGARALFDLGITQDISDALEAYGPHILDIWKDQGEEYSDRLWDIFTLDDGSIVGLAENPAMAGCATLVRKDWLDKYNLSVPKTIDELEACLAVIQENDPAGNGETIPFFLEAGSNGYGALAAGFMEHGYDAYFYDEADGKVKPIVYADGFKAFLEKMANWYAKGYLFKEYTSITDTSKKIEYLSSGKVFAFSGWNSRVGQSMKEIVETHGGEWVLLDNLQGPRGSVSTLYAPTDASTVVAKTASADAVEAFVKYVDWEYSDFYNYATAVYGIKGTDWEEGEPHEVASRTLEYVSEQLVAPNFRFTMMMETSDPYQKFNFWFYDNYLLDTEKNKAVSLFDEAYQMNLGTLGSVVPATDDVTRMITEELIKFIMNSRSLSEYDQFLKELDAAGVQQVIDELTSRYNGLKG